MIYSKRIAITKATAITACKRLLRDHTMRHHINDHDKPPNLVPPAFDPPDFSQKPVPPSPTSANRLSRAEQKQQILQIAYSFRTHYLAALNYLDDCDTTVAIIMPRHQADDSIEICIDADGNTTIRHKTARGADHQPGWRSLVLSVVLGITLGTLLFLVLV